jgi:hypothetical protein
MKHPKLEERPAKMARHGKQTVIRVFGFLVRLIEAAQWKRQFEEAIRRKN